VYLIKWPVSVCERIIELKKVKVQSRVRKFLISIKQLKLAPNDFIDFLDVTFEIQLIIYIYSKILYFRYLFDKFTIHFYVQKLCWG